MKIDFVIMGSLFLFGCVSQSESPEDELKNSTSEEYRRHGWNYVEIKSPEPDENGWSHELDFRRMEMAGERVVAMNYWGKMYYAKKLDRPDKMVWKAMPWPKEQTTLTEIPGRPNLPLLNAKDWAVVGERIYVISDLSNSYAWYEFGMDAWQLDTLEHCRKNPCSYLSIDNIGGLLAIHSYEYVEWFHGGDTKLHLETFNIKDSSWQNLVVEPLNEFITLNIFGTVKQNENLYLLANEGVFLQNPKDSIFYKLAEPKTKKGPPYGTPQDLIEYKGRLFVAYHGGDIVSSPIGDWNWRDEPTDIKYSDLKLINAGKSGKFKVFNDSLYLAQWSTMLYTDSGFVEISPTLANIPLPSYWEDTAKCFTPGAAFDMIKFENYLITAQDYGVFWIDLNEALFCNRDYRKLEGNFCAQVLEEDNCDKYK